MGSRPSVGKILQDIYNRLMGNYGQQHWWPAEAPFEVMIGAILTQSTAWPNVEKAIANLKMAGALLPDRLRQLKLSEITTLIYPCGYYNAKALKLKTLVHWLGECYHDDLEELFATDADTLRQELLSLYGIGLETADSIMLYAAQKPVFIVDAYTRRIINRVGLLPSGDSYAVYQALFMDNLPTDVGLFNEYHALLVCLGKDACRKYPRCQRCCLGDICHFGVDKYVDAKEVRCGEKLP